MSTTDGGDALELIKRLLRTQAAFVHEQTGAAREEAAAGLELARELEQTLSADSQVQVQGLEGYWSNHNAT